MSAYEYRVVKDYYSKEWDFELVEGDIVIDADFPEPDIPQYLIGRGVLEPADKKAEAKRLAGDHLWAVDESKKAQVQQVIDARKAQRNKQEGKI
jgi:hypothetical protein